MPGPPDYDGVCRNCGADEYVCSCGEADLVPAAEYYQRPDVLPVGSYWQRKPPGREVVEVQRVWDWTGQGWTVRAHPVRGGKPLIADVTWFRENYTLREGGKL